MAGTAVEIRRTGVVGSDVYQLAIQLNKVVDDLEKLRASLDAVCDKLDADGGVTDTNYATTADVAAASEMTAAKLNEFGSAIS